MRNTIVVELAQLKRDYPLKFRDKNALWDVTLQDVCTDAQECYHVSFAAVVDGNVGFILKNRYGTQSVYMSRNEINQLVEIITMFIQERMYE